MSWYHHKLERDLERWVAAGWVTPAGAGAIRNDLDARRKALPAAAILALLGAILFGFAVMSFVAAHWAGLSKLARLALLLASLWTAYAGAAVLFQRQLPAFAHAAVLAGIAVYGASIMLIAQMYHIAGHAPDAVLLWALGALLAAVLTRSSPALAATFVLLSSWTCWERLESQTAHGSFLIAWGAAALTAAWLRWRPGMHLAAISLVLWLVPLGFFIGDRHQHGLVSFIGVGVAAAAAAGGARIDRQLPLSTPLFSYGLAVGYAGLFILQFLDDGHWLMGAGAAAQHLWRGIALSILSIALLLAGALWALKTDNRPALWLAYGAFALEIFLIYVKTLGSFLNTSLFFLFAALIVSGLAWLAYRLHRSSTQPGAP
jgi:uncharacterized membrane protein